jgi:hypothetical protein
MRSFWVSYLILALSGLTAVGQAEEVAWHSAGSAPPTDQPAAGWHAPQPAILDPEVRQASYPLVAPDPLPVPTETTEPPALADGEGKSPDAAEEENATAPVPDFLPESAGQAPALAPSASSPAKSSPTPSAEAEKLPAPTPQPVEGSQEPAEFPESKADPCAEGMCSAPAACGCQLELSAEYLLWWTRGQRLPALVTTGPAGEPARGALGANGTVVLFGNQEADDQARSGGRLRGTLWLDPEQAIGLDMGGFLLEQVSTDFAANSDSIPVLARPVFLLGSNVEGRQLVATPAMPGGLLDLHGQVTVNTPSRFWGADAGLRGNLVKDTGLCLEALGGFRYLGLDEGLHVSADTLSLQAVPGVPALDLGNQLAIADRFDTHNRFYGGDVGLRASWHSGCWAVEGQARISLGVNDEIVDIAGSQTYTTLAGQQQQTPGGLLALPSNSGHFHQDRFAVVPEVGLKVSYQLTMALRVFVGYDFLFWNEVARPADQVDRTVDPRQLAPSGSGAGQSRPGFSFQQTTFWAQGVSGGLELRY